jgi:single-strand DNA-binding protein
MMNRTILVGRLTKDPDLRYTSNGVPVATFTLAINRPFQKENGEKEADFINIVVWRKPAENVANFLKKGSLAGVDGRIQTRNYEGQDGKRVYITEVVAESVQFLESKNKSSYQPPIDPPPERGNNTTAYSSNNESLNGDSIDIHDDDLPF